MTFQLPQDLTDLVRADAHAQSVADALNVVYWTAGSDVGLAEFMLRRAHERFAELAEALGYTVTRAPDGDAAAARARQMNAELPQAARDVLAIKGMI